MNLNLLIKSLIVLFGLLLSVQVVLAEQADRTKPVNIEADSVDMDDLHKVGLYLGNVVLTQGTLLLRADKIQVHQDADGFSTAVAFGNPVYFRQKQDGVDEYVEGYASRIDLDNKQNTLLLTGHAILKKGADELHANTMLYNTVTQHFWAKIDPNVLPGVAPNRVRTAIFPKTMNQAPPGSGVTPAPGATPVSAATQPAPGAMPAAVPSLQLQSTTTLQPGSP